MKKELNNLIGELSGQINNEIEIARTYKQKKISGWHENEDLYYGKKDKTENTRANVSLGQTQEFIHTLLSKIDDPLIFKFRKRKESQESRVQLLNALREFDRERDSWDLKDIIGKKQAVLYGRAIYFYSAIDDKDGYRPNLEPIDVYDFLIDPNAGGLDIEKAMYLGRWGIVKSRKELEAGVKSGQYIKEQVNALLEGDGTGNDETQEDENKNNRLYNNENKIEDSHPDKYKLWEWFTTYKGVRYYVLLSSDGTIIRLEELKNLFTSELYPVWTWACFPDLTEFWTPSYLDYAKEIFMAQEASINQMLDNAEAINQPQKIIDVSALEDISKVIKYRKNGIIPVKKGVDVKRAVQFIQVPAIQTPIQVFEKLQQIQDRASGVTANVAGTADEDGKVGIYEGNLKNTADRFGLLNKSYAFGYKRFARLYEWGIKDHLTKKIAVDILGPEGVEVKEVSKADLYRAGDNYALLVEASSAELSNNIMNQKIKLGFLNSQAGNPNINQDKLFELQARISGFDEQEIKELLDVNLYGNEELLAEAERDIERLLDGEQIEPNEIANNAYKQRFVNYLRNHKEDIDNEQFFRIASYLDQLEPIIMRNEARKMTSEVNDMLDEQLTNNPTSLGGGTINPQLGEVEGKNYDIQTQQGQGNRQDGLPTSL